MKFIVPLSAGNELDALADYGADEVYLGYMDEAWSSRFGDHDSISRRQGKANLAQRAELAQVAADSQRRGVPAYLTLNARYTNEQYPYLLKLVMDWEAMGGAGLHLFDLGLLTRLRDAGSNLHLSLSLLAATASSDTALFYKDYGIERIVFPRFLTPAAMGEILAASGLVGEAMIMGDGCPFVDGYCRGWHGVGYVTAPGPADHCLQSYDVDFEDHLCRKVYGQPAGIPCGACVFESLEAAGVTWGKMGGRGWPLDMRLAQLDFLIACRGTGQAERPGLYRETFGGACRCYYPQGGAG